MVIGRTRVLVKYMRTYLLSTHLLPFSALHSPLHTPLHTPSIPVPRYRQPALWHQRRLAYVRSVAVNSIIGYVVGLGDRHNQNILLDAVSAEVVHIDFGITFEQVWEYSHSHSHSYSFRFASSVFVFVFVFTNSRLNILVLVVGILTHGILQVVPNTLSFTFTTSHTFSHRCIF